MADLEALTRIDPAASSASGVIAAPGQYSWRYTLPEAKVVRLGSDPVASDWSVPEDKMISRYHATLEWNGAVLVVTRRPVIMPDFPDRPRNQIWFHNKPVERFEVKPGEWFVIGQTRFTLRGDADSEPDSPVDATVVQRQEERSRAELENLPFSNPTLLLKAMERLPTYLRLANDEPSLFRQMLKVALDAMPKCDAAAVVRVPDDCPAGDLRITVAAQQVRMPGGAAGEFVPSRKLVRRVVCRGGKDRKSILHVWSTDPSDFNQGSGSDHNLTLGAMHQQGATPWAICTPFMDASSPCAFYVSGRVLARGPGDGKPEQTHLTEYQKFIEILVGLLEMTRRTLRLTRQLATAKMTWPGNLRRLLDDPDRLESLLKTPQEKDVTVLFCDLRGYSRDVEAKGENLAAAWAEVQKALDTMSSSVTDKGGVVAGFRGDAVLGFWGWPERHGDQIEKAAEAALRIYNKLNGPMMERKCGLGLTHGRALAGRLGAHDLAVVDLYGPVVNLAFRLEEMTKSYGVGIVISDEVAKLLREADPASPRWRLRSLGQVRPRGVVTPLNVFELAPSVLVGSTTWVSSDNYDTYLPLWDEAVALFIKGDWSAASAKFDDYFTEDPAAKCFLRHINRHNGSPPAKWDGAFTPRPEEEAPKE